MADTMFSAFFWNATCFVIAIVILIGFHEFGHYWAARRCGVKVLRFSIGFGRVLWSRTAKDGVEWSVAAFPLGGYVKMLDEREGEVPADQRHLAFNNVSVWRRMIIVAAGPAFNLILAVAFYWAMFVVGVEGLKTVVAEPAAGTPAAAAGLHSGDLIESVNGAAVGSWTTMRTELIDHGIDRGTLQLQVRDPQGRVRAAEMDLQGVRIEPEYLFDDLGLSVYQPPIPPRLREVMPTGTAAAAGLKPGDLILSRDGVPVPSWADLVQWVQAHPAMVTKIEVDRGGERLVFETLVGSDKQGEKTIGRIGVLPAVPEGDLWQNLRAVTRLGPVQAVPAAVGQTWQMAKLTVKLLYKMVCGEISLKNISGPINTAQVVGYAAKIGLAAVLSIMAIVSVSLAVVNLLPVPLLDGGHLLYYAIEAVKGSPVSERMQEAGQKLGLTFLVMLMSLAFYNDIMRLMNS